MEKKKRERRRVKEVEGSKPTIILFLLGLDL